LNSTDLAYTWEYWNENLLESSDSYDPYGNYDYYDPYGNYDNYDNYDSFGDYSYYYGDYYTNLTSCDIYNENYTYSVDWYRLYEPSEYESLKPYGLYFKDAGIDACDINSWQLAYEAPSTNPNFYCEYFNYCDGSSRSQMRSQVKPSETRRFLAQAKALS
jgi:hypothetical protein